jgi:hypothetical protein
MAKLPCDGPLPSLADVQRGGNECVTKLRDDADGRRGESPMLVIVLAALLAISVAIVAMVTASPLYRTLANALDHWAEPPAPKGRARH